MKSEIERRAWSAQQVIEALVDTCTATGLKLPPSWRAIVGRHAKLLLADGFPPDVVTAASYMAVLRGRPEITQYIAGDLMLAATGQRMSRAEYEQKLALYAAGNGRAQRMLAEQRERIAARETEIERRRSGEA